MNDPRNIPHHPFWSQGIEKVHGLSSFPILAEEREADVAIIGGGITGLTAAWQLKRKSSPAKKIIVLEAKTIASGTTGNSTGNLYIPIQNYYQTLFIKFGPKIVEKVALARKSAIGFVENLVKEKNLQCHFARRPWYLYTKEKDKASLVKREVEILQKSKIDIDFCRELPLPLPFKVAARMDDQARINPLLYAKELSRHLAEDGVEIFENSPVLSMKEKKNYCLISCPQGKIKAGKVLVCTHIPQGVHYLQTLCAPYRSYVVAAGLRSGTYPDANIWDCDSPHHTLSTHPSSGTGGEKGVDILVISGNHHKTGQAKAGDHLQYFRVLEERLKSRFQLDRFRFEWSAQHYQSSDGLPYIGPAGFGSKHTYVATGYYADGLTYGTMAGILLSEIVLGIKHDWEEIFQSTRFNPLRTAPTFLKENLNVAAQYAKDYLFSPISEKCKNHKNFPPGTGKVFSRSKDHKGQKLAVYKDEKENLHVLSAVCPHLKCIVHWNNAEKSWDCPCHGSRFDGKGQWLEGPSTKDLDPVPDFDELGNSKA